MIQTSKFLLELQSYRSERNRRSGLDYSKLTTDQTDRLLCDLLAHTMEELTELRMCLNRKPWKPMPSLRCTSAASVSLREAAVEELADVLLMLDAWRDAADFSLLEVTNAVRAKMAKNMLRDDHTVNQGTR